MKKCILHIIDQVNCKFKNVDPETRRTISEALKIFIPAAKYSPAYRLGRWDACARFFTPAGSCYLPLLDKVIPLLIDAGYDIEIIDDRPQSNFQLPQIDEFFLADTMWPKGHPFEGEPIMLRDHQVRAINTFLQSPTGIQSLPTSAGKTILSAALSKAVEPHRSIVICPNKSLILQTYADYANVGLDVGMFYGDRKEWDKTHTIATWQSLSVFSKKSRQGDAPVSIEKFLEGVACVMVDEVHTASANELKDLLTGPMANIPLRWGFSGSLPKEPHLATSIRASLGDVLGGIAPKELQEKGILANCEIEMIQTVDDVEYVDYFAEREYLATDTKRLEWIADYCKKCVDEFGNTLVLVNGVEFGKRLSEMCDTPFVYGGTPVADRTVQYKEFADVDGKMLVATYGVASTGISIGNLYCLVQVDATSSEIIATQAAGRILRVTKTKKFAHIKDISSTAKFSAKHNKKRRALYKELEYPFTTRKVKYR